MANTADIEPDLIASAPPPRRRGGLVPVLIGVILALSLGGGGFFAAWTGTLPNPLGGDEEAEEEEAPPPVRAPDLPPISFVPLPELVISLGRGARARHLVFAATLEVDPAYLADVELLIPRVLDVANTYLRALDEKDVEDPAAMLRLRAQLLRRVQVVTGEGRVRDLLVTQFVLQ